MGLSLHIERKKRELKKEIKEREKNYFFLSGSGHKIKKVFSKLAKPEGTGSNSMGNEGRKGQT